jgi:hypothetical protein
MENNIKSSNSNLGNSSSYVFPSIYQLILYFLVSILILTLLNIKNAWTYLNDTVLKPNGGLDSIVAQSAPGVHHFLNSLSQSIILQVIFWIFVGCAVYLLIWFIKNVAINLLNDITADQYIHPKTYRRSLYWSGILSRRIFFWTSAIVLLGYLIESARFMGYIADICYQAILVFKPLQSSLDILESAIVTTGLIYILVLITHVCINSWRLIYKDL